MDGSTANLLRRFLQRAPDALTDEELLTLLLHAGTGAEEPRTLAARLIGQFGSLGYDALKRPSRRSRKCRTILSPSKPTARPSRP